MKERNLEFYIDESGSFMDDAPEKMQHPEEKSLVGGYLYDPACITNEYINTLLPYKVHCCQEYKKYYIDALEKVYSDGVHFVVFENKERIKVVNGDVTYLNIISEGLIQLLSDLPLEYPDQKVNVHVVVATRKAMSGGTGIIQFKEYRNRLEEKLFIAMHRSKTMICDYTLDFADARTSKRHDLADIVCNTYMTRNRKKKFSDEERKRIEGVYDPKYIYPVFEDATIGYLKQLLSESRFSEMIYQICTLTKLQGVTDLRNKLLIQICKSNALERKAYFSYISLQLGLYNDRRMYFEGIRFAENYKQYILNPLGEHIEIKNQELDYWFFDTDFYILTMYDHIGNASMCEKYLNECNKNIYAINHSWEHIDYYFKFRIRELNCLMGRFDFESVIEKSDNLINIFSSAKELFGMIETYDNTSKTLQSELLGKAYGVQVEAYTNLINAKPELIDRALAASDSAIAEFSSPVDLQRQYQYRCSLLVTVGRAEDALTYLLKSYDLSLEQKNVFSTFVTNAYSGRTNSDAFALWHYTNVMLLLSKLGNTIADEMFRALIETQSFVDDLKDFNKDGYPWNMVLWNISRWYLKDGAYKAADTFCSQSIKITQERPEQVTMYSFSISMIANKLHNKLQNNTIEIQEAQKQMKAALSRFSKFDLPETMRRHFYTDQIDNINENILARLSEAYLK